MYFKIKHRERTIFENLNYLKKKKQINIPANKSNLGTNVDKNIFDKSSNQPKQIQEMKHNTMNSQS